jgi:phage terminase Nu1 subunit (DNA packaging protein)
MGDRKIMASPPTHSLDTISKLLDLTPRRVQQLAKEGVIPRAERGRYELVLAVRGYIRYLKERSLNPGVISFDEVRARKTAAEAEMAELELSERKKQLVPMEDVAEKWLELISTCRTKILSMPAKLAGVVAVEDNPAVCKSIIEEQTTEALDELSGWIESEVGDEDSDQLSDDGGSGGLETTTDANG